MTELFLGIDLGGSHISAWLLDRKGNTHNPLSKTGINSCLSSEELINHLVRLINTQRAPMWNHNVLAIGLASPGPLDPHEGVIISPPNLFNIKNLEVVKILREKTDLPTFLINDADAAVLGEGWLGSARGLINVVMLTLGTGIGSGVISNGLLLRGRGMGGEWGHTSIFFGDQRRLCSCGRWNCLEAFCGTEGLLKTYSRFFPFQTCQEVSKKMIENWSSDHVWEKVFRVYCRCLTEGIINIVNAHHPECIVLGGGIAHSNIVEKVKENLKTPTDLYPNQSWSQYKLKVLLDGLEIRLAILEHSGIIGSAKHAINCYETEIEKHKAEHGVVS